MIPRWQFVVLPLSEFGQQWVTISCDNCIAVNFPCMSNKFSLAYFVAMLLFSTGNEKEIDRAAICARYYASVHEHFVEFHGSTVRSLVVFLPLGMKKMAQRQRLGFPNSSDQQQVDGRSSNSQLIFQDSRFCPPHWPEYRSEDSQPSLINSIIHSC